MARTPNEETPAPLVPDNYVPPSGTRRPVAKGETWVSVASGLGIDSWDLIDFNFPGIKRVRQTNHERATRQVNWYLHHYVGCNSTTDYENWDFDSGLIDGRGNWRSGFIYIPSSMPKPIPPVKHACNPTTSGKIGRRPTQYRLLTSAEREMVRKVFGQPFPYLDTVGIGNGLGFDGRPWTDTGPLSEPGLPVQLQYQINIGDAMMVDLTGNEGSGCYIVGITGTVSDLLIHEMTHVWQYYTKGGMTGRYRVWGSSVAGSYNFKLGEPWQSYDVEQQASIVEEWFHNGSSKTDPIYAYIKLVLQSRGDALEYASGLNLNELNRDLAYLRARNLD
jgi:hypothetical protein